MVDDFVVIRGPNGVMKARNLKLITHEINIQDVTPQPIVEFTVVGRTSEWRDFLAKDIFDLLNPNIEVN